MNHLPFAIERTRNRTSRATIRYGQILIRLAGHLSAREEERHIAVLLKRMTKAFLREQTKVRIDPFATLLKGELTDTIHLVTGQSVIFEIKIGETAKVKAVQGGWQIKRTSHTDTRAFHRLLWRLLAKSADASVNSLVHGINEETLKARIGSITLKLMRSRWGSCGRRGQIALSTPLLLTRPDILQYVILHELTHIPHPNHSAAFWKKIAEFMPEYRERVKELRKFKLSMKIE